MNKRSKEDLDPFVEKIIKTIDILQEGFTFTGWIRFIYETYKRSNKKHGDNERLPKAFYTIWVSSWLIFVVLLSFSPKTYPLIKWVIVYRLWEMLIVNIWLFLVYGQLGRGNLTQFNVFRIVCMLTWQYLTIWFSYAVIFRTIFHSNPNYFIGVVEDTAFNWLFFSISTLTTMGYSGIQPCQNSPMIQAIITTEVFMGIFFVVLLLGATIARLDIRFDDTRKK